MLIKVKKKRGLIIINPGKLKVNLNSHILCYISLWRLVAHFITMQGHKYSHICNLWGKFLPVGMICTTTDAISIPMGMHAPMGIDACTSLACTHGCTWKNVLCTRSYIFYSHGCNKFLHARTFITLVDTTFILMGKMHLHASMFCTFTHRSSIPMGAINFYMQERFLHSLIQFLYPCV